MSGRVNACVDPTGARVAGVPSARPFDSRGWVLEWWRQHQTITGGSRRVPPG
jgi:hypothetical protein